MLNTQFVILVIILSIFIYFLYLDFCIFINLFYFIYFYLTGSVKNRCFLEREATFVDGEDSLRCMMVRNACCV